jgi:hypothetical protein
MAMLPFFWFDSIYYFTTEKRIFQHLCSQIQYEPCDIIRVDHFADQLQAVIDRGVYNSTTFVTFVALLVQFKMAIEKAQLVKNEE